MFGFSELEDSLLGENSQAALKEALVAVRSVAKQAEDAIAGGLPQDDHVIAEGIRNAAHAAEMILLSPVKPDGA